MDCDIKGSLLSMAGGVAAVKNPRGLPLAVSSSSGGVGILTASWALCYQAGPLADSLGLTYTRWIWSRCQAVIVCAFCHYMKYINLKTLCLQFTVRSDDGVPGGVPPLRISNTELDMVLNESPDSLRCQGAFPNNFLVNFEAPCSSLRPVLDRILLGGLKLRSLSVEGSLTPSGDVGIDKASRLSVRYRHDTEMKAYLFSRHVPELEFKILHRLHTPLLGSEPRRRLCKFGSSADVDCWEHCLHVHIIGALRNGRFPRPM
jgi:hypothetical protein